jgi:hypothetical protein
MSTNIADLPGPKPEEYEEDEYVQEDEYEEEPNMEEFNHQPSREMYYEQPPDIQMNIKKVKRKEQKEQDESMFDMITKEVNEENLLILVILYIASTSLLDEYAKKLLTLVSFNHSSMFVNIVKCVILLLAFILVKNYFLPYIKV